MVTDPIPRMIRRDLTKRNTGSTLSSDLKKISAPTFDTGLGVEGSVLFACGNTSGLLCTVVPALLFVAGRGGRDNVLREEPVRCANGTCS